MLYAHNYRNTASVCTSYLIKQYVITGSSVTCDFIISMEMEIDITILFFIVN